MKAAAGIISFALALVVSTVVVAQQPWSIGGRAHYGFLWPHRPSSWILVEGHAAAVEVFAERKANGDRPWQVAFGLPSYGVGVLCTGMANPDRIGAAVRVVPYLFLPFKQGEHGAFGLRMGWGVGYIAKSYDRHGNSKQIAIGSRINTAIQLMPEYRYRAGRWMLATGIAIDHWSNGSVRQPNLGLNLLTVNVAVSHALGDEVGKKEMNAAAFEAAQREMMVVGAIGMNERGRPLNGQYTVYSLTGQVQWRVGRKGAVGAGADVFNKGSLASGEPDLVDEGRAALTQFGLHGAGSLLFGRAELFANAGAYAYTPVADDAPLFQRIGIRYRSGKHLVWNVSLKSHYVTADHWEFGLGYRWN